MSSQLFKELLNPPKNCDNITPELPVAPINDPRAINEAVSFAEEELLFSSSSMIASTVRYIFAPVSPSATGKTFIAFKCRRYFFSRFAEACIILFNNLPLNN